MSEPRCTCGREPYRTYRVPDPDCPVHGVDAIQRASRRRALQPFLWCTLPGLVLVAFAALLDTGWLAGPGWVLLVAACGWAGIRWWRAERQLRAAKADLRAWYARNADPDPPNRAD
jgi:hypothetical protein